MTIPGGVEKIAKRAFAGCKNLSAVKLNRTERIAEDAFEACGKPVITAPRGSYATEFAKGIRR